MDTLKPINMGINIGIDIGQKHDPTAIVVAQRELRGYTLNPNEGRDGRGVYLGGEIHYIARFIQRLPLNTSYPDVAKRLAEIYHNVPDKVEQCLIDVTGVGRPVFDLVKNDIDATAVTLTGSDKMTEEDSEIRLGKVLMVSNLQVLLQTQRIHLPDNDESQVLIDELMNYELKVSENAHLTMGAKTGAHDDLATGLGLACFETPKSYITVEWYSEGDPMYEALYHWRGG